MRTNRYFLLALAVIIAILWLIREYLRSSDPRLADLVFAYGFCATLATLGVIAWLSARRMRERAIIEELERMKQAGLLTTTTYTARRAFRLRGNERDSLRYFLELENGRVLVLEGSYLYQEDGHSDFPCKQFTIERHTEHGYVLDLLCEGAPIMPEADMLFDETAALKYYPECPDAAEAFDLFETTYPDNTILEDTYDSIFTRLQETQPDQISGM